MKIMNDVCLCVIGILLGIALFVDYRCLYILLPILIVYVFVLYIILRKKLTSPRQGSDHVLKKVIVVFLGVCGVILGACCVVGVFYDKALKSGLMTERKRKPWGLIREMGDRANEDRQKMLEDFKNMGIELKE